MDMTCLFQAYGITVRYPSEWRIYIPQSQSCCWKDGVLKFDDVSGADSRASFTLSWEDAGPVEGFAAAYLESAEKNYKKKVKGRCRIVEKKLEKLNGHEAGFLEAGLSSNTHVFRAMGKALELTVMQTACYCNTSGRIIMGTVIAEQKYFEKNRTLLEGMLMGIKCHSENGSEESEEHAYSKISCPISD